MAVFTGIQVGAIMSCNITPIDPKNIQVANGILHIIARKENFGGKQYTSARIQSLGKLSAQYGRFEARIKVPAGQGFWPAF